MKKICCGIMILSIFGISGCAPLIVGAALGAAGVHVISKDSVGVDTDKGYDNIWNAAMDVASSKGIVKRQDMDRGYIEVTLNTATRAWIRLSPVTRSTTRLKVSARKHHLPNFELAQEILVKILDQSK